MDCAGAGMYCVTVRPPTHRQTNVAGQVHAVAVQSRENDMQDTMDAGDAVHDESPGDSSDMNSSVDHSPRVLGDNNVDSMLSAVTEALGKHPLAAGVRAMHSLLQDFDPGACIPHTRAIPEAAWQTEKEGRRSGDGGLNKSELIVYQYVTGCELSVDKANELLRILRDPGLNLPDLRFCNMQTYHQRVLLGQAGIQGVDLKHEGDGVEELMFWFRPVWQILRRQLMLPTFAKNVLWAYSPEYVDGTNERVYSVWNGGRWLEAAYAALKSPGATIMGVLIGTDAALFKKRVAGHPMYVSLANLREEQRSTPAGWCLVGFLPDLDQTTMSRNSEFHYKRRLRQVLTGALCHLFKDAWDVAAGGGDLVVCGDRCERLLLPMLAVYATDRQEHERVLGAKAHSCWHCCCAPDEKARAVHFTARTAAGVRMETVRAMMQGVYGGANEWQAKIQKQLPIVKVATSGTGLDVVSEDRYAHCATVTGFYPEPNIFLNQLELQGVDLLHICRDDPMHMVELGLMPHLMQASLAKCIDVLSPDWAIEIGAAPGHLDVERLCARITCRLRRSAPYLSNWCSNCFQRAYAHVVSSRGQAQGLSTMKWQLTAAEMDVVFRASCICWAGLIQDEITCLNTHSGRPSNAPLLKDPGEDIHRALGTFLTWYNGMRLRRVSESTVLAFHVPMLPHVWYHVIFGGVSKPYTRIPITCHHDVKSCS